MLMFIIGFVAGVVAWEFTPAERRDQLRGWIITKWEKVTKKG